MRDLFERILRASDGGGMGGAGGGSQGGAAGPQTGGGGSAGGAAGSGSGGAGGGAGGASSGGAASTSVPSGGSPQSVQPSVIESGASGAPDDSFIDIPADLDGLDSVTIPPEAGGAAPVAGTEAPAPVAPVLTSPQPQAAPPAQQQAPQEPSPITHPDQVTLDNVMGEFEREREGLQEHWAQQFFQLSQEESDALATAPEQVLPRLMAKTLYMALSSVPAQISRFVPGLIQQVSQQTAVQERASGDFFGMWPGLNGKTDVIANAIQFVRATQPQLRGADAYRKVGEVACMALGIDPSSVRSVGGASQGNAGAGGIRPGQPVAPAFRPAGAAGGGGAMSQPMNGGMSTDADDPWGAFTLPHHQ